MGMHPTKDRVESDTSNVYSISLYESTITTRDEPLFGELKLANGGLGLPVTARDRILRCSPPVVGTTRAGPENKSRNRGNKIPHLIGGGKRIDISIFKYLFYSRWERTAKSIRIVQSRKRGDKKKRAKRMQNGHGEKEVWRRTSSFPLLPGPKAVFPGLLKDLGLLATRNPFFDFKN